MQMPNFFASAVRCGWFVGILLMLPMDRAAATQADSAYAEMLRQGHAYLDAQDYTAARRAFRRATGLARGDAEGYYGLGLVHMALPTKRYQAISYFRRALVMDPTFADARYQIAHARYLMKELDTETEIRRVLDIDPDYADAYLLMGDWFAVGMEDYGRAIIWYTRYLEMRPHDAEARRKLGMAYLRVQNYDRIREILLDYVHKHPDAVAVMPILAQACIRQNQVDAAMQFFETYIARLDPDTRAHYDDIRLIASQEEMAQFEQISLEDREAFLTRFWNGRDPDLSTPVNERLLEHYRRVWYALTAFSDAVQPWDRRGEVYIRFGEPDHRTRSREMSLSSDPAVQRVRERLAVELYGASSVGELFVGPVFPVRNFALERDVLGFETRPGTASMDGGIALDEGAGLDVAEFFSEEERSAEERLAEMMQSPEKMSSADWDVMSASARRSSRRVEPNRDLFLHIADATPSDPFSFAGSRPVMGSGEDLGSVAWESWIYTRIDGGIEIAFVDAFGSGAYDFAPIPAGPEIAVDQMARFWRFSPRRTFERAAQVTPDFYAPAMGAPSLDFYYAVADFRGSAGRSSLEVYFGIPGASVKDAVLVRDVALVPVPADTVYRFSDERVYARSDNLAEVGVMVPGAMRLAVPPGAYRMEVKARDRQTGRTGLYRQMVEVAAYGRETLQVSGLQLAWRAGEAQGDGPFVKGHVEVIPMPSRTYRKGQNAFVYYEIYNLARDVFGQTQYQVVYTIGSAQTGGILSRLAQTLKGRQKSEVAVGYEGRGTVDWEGVYTELDLGEARSGRHYLKVVVTDLNSGATVEKQTLFAVVE